MALQTYFDRLNISSPTAMQSDFITSSGPFSILLSNTGSGKTFAFLIRLAQELEKAKSDEVVLILSPTRELALQLSGEFKKMQLGISSIVCYGGHSFKNEQRQFFEKPRVVISTPGRILDHYERSTEGLSHFNKLIIDEYDKTLELGFLSELEQIYHFKSRLDYIHLISASEIDRLPAFISSNSFQTFNYLERGQLKLKYFSVEADQNDKLHALALLLSTFDFSPTIIFCNHREATERISGHLVQYGKEHVVFHGGLEQEERERALVKFKNGTVDCILATDLISRGIDIPDVQQVIHYQYPPKKDDFIHRNGRTARMKASGAIYLIHSENEPLPEYLSDEKFQKLTLPSEFQDYEASLFTTLYLNVGRKQKVRKTDIVGVLTTDFKIPFEEIGQIVVYDQYSYLALTKKMFSLHRVNFQKIRIKKMSARLSLCR